VTNRFRKHPQADHDLDSIWSFVATDSVGAADKQSDRIGKVFETFVQNPLAGRERSELRQGLRSFPVGSYVIFIFRYRWHRGNSGDERPARY
jgi:toxin ParE1/3/4